MNISVVIPTFNRESVLTETVRAVIRQEFDGNYEVIVVNDGAKFSQPLEDFFRRLENVRCIYCGGKGAAHARNLGADAASYELLLFLDDDIVVRSDHLACHLQAIERFQAACITANRKERDDLVQLLRSSAFGRYKLKYDYTWHENSIVQEIDDRFRLLSGSATFSCSILADRFKRIGGFDSSYKFAGSEDVDFFERAKSTGVQLVFDTQNICFHNEPFNADPTTWFRRHYTGASSFVRLCCDHPRFKEFPRYWQFQPIGKGDSLRRRCLKIKGNMFRSKLTQRMLWLFVRVAGRLRAPDLLMFKAYNALYLAHWSSGMQDFALER